MALFSAISAPPRAKLVDARPKAWHDERGGEGRRWDLRSVLMRRP